jgi:hypothetical protein
MRSLSGPRYPSPILVPAVRADIPDMARVYADAERPNLLTRVLWSPEKLAKNLIKELDENFDNPRLLITKALDADTKELTAFGIWQLTGYDSKELGVDQSTLKSSRPSNFKAGLYCLLTRTNLCPQLGSTSIRHLKSSSKRGSRAPNSSIYHS